jgi:GAF domain-containing protein
LGRRGKPTTSAPSRSLTLRADSLPAVRQFAKRLRGAATGEIAKYEAAVLACSDLGFDYVAFYRLESTDPLRLSLRAQSGPAPAQAAAPKQASAQDIVGWVAQNGQTRFAGPGDEFTYALVTSGHMGAAICLPVSSNVTRYGVLVACRQQPDSITQEHVLTLELISVQLAAAISKENIG